MKHLLGEPRKFCIEYKNILSWVDKLGEFHLGGEMVSSSGVERYIKMWEKLTLFMWPRVLVLNVIQIQNYSNFGVEYKYEVL